MASAFRGRAWSDVSARRRCHERCIHRLGGEIKALTDVDQFLGASAPAARSASRRSSPRKVPTSAETRQPEVKPQRKRREMTAAEKKAVSEHMTAYWAERRKKAAKKKVAKK